LQTFVVRKSQSDIVTKLRGSAKIERTTPPAAATPTTPAPVPAPGAK
jgi:hypothetical protein